MSNYYVGTLDTSQLSNLGFTKEADSTSLLNCMTIAKTKSKKFIAMQPNPNQGNVINFTGKCYVGTNYNPVENQGAANATFQVYPVPESSNCASLTDINIQDCVRNNTKTALMNEISLLKNQITGKNTDLDNIQIKILALEEGKTLQDAAATYRARQDQIRMQNERATLQDKMDLFNKQLEILTNASSNANQQLADKNRLLATVNSNIQKTYTRLEEVNGDINTITQEIYENNKDIDRKDQIIKTLNALITVFVILILVMIVYYGVDFAKARYPDAYASFTNNFKNFNLGQFKFANNPFI